MHINASAMTKEEVLGLAAEQLDKQLKDVALAQVIFSYVQERVDALPDAGGRAYEITADVNIAVEAYLRIA